MFERAQLDALYADFRNEWQGKPDYEKILRDVHLGIAYFDSGRPIDQLNPVAVSFIEKYKPT